MSDLRKLRIIAIFMIILVFTLPISFAFEIKSSSVNIEDIDESSKKIVWQTDKEADTYIEYGKDASSLKKEDAFRDTGNRNDFVYYSDIGNLDAGSKYLFRISASPKDGVGNPMSTDFLSFVMNLDKVNNVVHEIISSESFKVSWDEVTGASSYNIYLNNNLFGNLRNNQIIFSNNVVDYNNQGVSLKSAVKITPGTEYKIIVEALGVDGNKGEKSTEITLTTKNPPSNIENLKVTNRQASSATITWDTDENSDSILQYGKTTAVSLKVSDNEQVKQHSITLLDLEPGVKYYYQAISNDVLSSIGFFETLSDDPNDIDNFIQGVTVDVTSQSTATIKWTTGTPTLGYVKYGISQSLENKKTDSAKTSNHEIDLTGLLSGSTYYFQVYSDGIPNDIQTFNTEGNTGSFLSITAPPGITNNAAYNLVGTSSKQNIKLYVFINDNPISSSVQNIPSGNFRIPLTLNSKANYNGILGNNHVKIIGWDLDGVKDKKEFQIRLDISKPSLKVDPIPTITNQGKVTVSGVVSGAKQVKAILDRSGSGGSAGSLDENKQTKFSYEVSTGSDGDHNITVSAIDSAGNIAQEIFGIKVDRKAPTITFDTEFTGKTHFKLFRIKGKTEPGAKVTATNFGHYSGCEDVDLKSKYIDCDTFLEESTVRVAVDPVSMALGSGHTVTANEKGEFSVAVSLMAGESSFSGKIYSSEVNNIIFTVTDDAGNKKTIKKQITYEPGCLDWKVGEMQTFPFNIYTRELTSGNIDASAFFFVNYMGSGSPNITRVSLFEDKSNKGFLTDTLGLDRNAYGASNENKYASLGSPKTSAYDEAKGGFYIYAPVRFGKYSGSIEDLPDKMNVNMGLSIVYKDLDGEASCNVYPIAQYDVQKPEYLFKWLSPEHINSTIETLDEVINAGEDFVDILEDAVMYTTVACAGMVAYDYIKGFFSSTSPVSTSSSGQQCTEQQMGLKWTYYACDRVLCPSAAPRCEGVFGDYGNEKQQEALRKAKEYNEKLRKTEGKTEKDYWEKCNEDGLRTGAPLQGVKEKCNTYDDWLNDQNSSYMTPGEIEKEFGDTSKDFYFTEIPDSSDIGGTKMVDYYVQYLQVKNGQVIQKASISEGNDKVDVNVYLSPQDPKIQREAQKCENGVLIIRSIVRTDGSSGYFGGEEEDLSRSITCEEDARKEELGPPSKETVPGCYDEECPNFDQTKCFGKDNINPPGGLWSSARCLCLPGMKSHLENYLKILKGAKKCLQQALIGEVRGGFCERLMAQFICDLLIEAIKLVFSGTSGVGDYPSSGDTETSRGVLSKFKENSAKVTEGIEGRYGDIVEQKMGLSGEQLVNKVCVAAVAMDWSLLEGLTDSIVDTVNVEPVVTVYGESRPFGYDPTTGRMNIGYNIYAGVIPGGDNTQVSAWLECDPSAAGGNYCGTSVPNMPVRGVPSVMNRDDMFNENLAFTDNNAVYWYNVVKIKVIYSIGGEQKEKTLTKEIWKKGDVAAGCMFSLTGGISCDTINFGDGAMEGIVEAGKIDKDSVIIPNSLYYPGNKVAARISVRSTMTDPLYVRIKHSDSEQYEYRLPAPEEYNSKQYYNLWIATVEGTSFASTLDEGEKKYKPLTDIIEIKEPNEKLKAFFKIENLPEDNSFDIKISYNVKLKVNGNDVSQRSEEILLNDLEYKDYKDYEDIAFIEKVTGKIMDDYKKIDEITIDEIKIYEISITNTNFLTNMQTTPSVFICVNEDKNNCSKDNFVEWKIILAEGEGSTQSTGPAGSTSASASQYRKEVTVMFLRDTTNSNTGDTTIGYGDSTDQSFTIKYETTSSSSGKPFYDYVEPVGDYVPSEGPFYVGFNLIAPGNEIDLIELEILGKEKQAGYSCTYYINEDDKDVSNWEVFQVKEDESGDDSSCPEVKISKRTTFGKDGDYPPFIEIKITPKSNFVREQDSVYNVNIRPCKGTNCASTKNKQIKFKKGTIDNGYSGYNVCLNNDKCQSGWEKENLYENTMTVKVPESIKATTGAIAQKDFSEENKNAVVS